MDVILASSSPRRQELLKVVVPQFTVIPADIDETIPNDVLVNLSAEYLAIQKARKIATVHPTSLVIGCDTIVVVDNEILGKPIDNSDAKRMLSILSGKTHKVITGVCLINNGTEHHFSETTEVEFYKLSEKEISDYINTDEPFDKAGGYGIQGKGSLLVKGITGDYFNVVGLPVSRLNKELNQIHQYY